MCWPDYHPVAALADFDLRFIVAHLFLGKADVYWNRQVIMAAQVRYFRLLRAGLP